MTDSFNPLDMENLGLSVGTALLTSEVHPLGDVPSFRGAGVYAIYYHGPLPYYSALVTATVGGEVPVEVPIYVGKAVPEGARTGVSITEGSRTRKLSQRLNKHAESVRAAENLDIADFTCRWLVVEPIWIPLGESVTIARFAPVWNVIVPGFGNHDPGAGRRQGLRTRWDTLHPGRAFAPLFPERPETAEDIAADVAEYLAQRYQV
ncbi:Eco29kI family restriction endonuclease [Mycobacterium sp. TY813]|uniref:Eco29kI family restriction endonuclease n=1 Tax=Mycobacterium TaxID=1763 RepID=UPI0027411ADA|nr:Eco29kI family restriction endonuclease [Mycobacterium sp. TY813]MDP7727620.1 Eco29kI family restriction endonuclease [Mycobacterium sp. TY813]